MMRFSVAGAVASHIGVDVAEMEQNYRYQPTRTPCAVYNDRDGTEYLTATTNRRLPRTSNDYVFGRWIWRKVETTGYVKAMGWQVWRALHNDEEPMPGDASP